MARPYDWSPLAGSDPVPGDPAGIRSEAARLSGVAKMIEDQVAVLRKIATGQSDERGLHLDKLQAAASDTADKLGKVSGRYQQTASALTAWAPELEHAQSQSLKALTAAQEAASRQRANQPVQRPAGAKLTDAEKQSDHARANALSQANSDLAAAHAMLDGAVSHRDTAAAETKRKIDSAIDDGVTDGFWDHVSAFIHKYAWLIKDIATALEVLATVLAIVALFVSGIGVLLLAGLIVGALLLRTVLAVNGDGSWSDVALDAVALLTLGLGTGAGALLGRFAGGAAETAEGFLRGERMLQELGSVSKLADDPEAATLLGEDSPAGALKNVLKPLEDSSAGQRFLEGGDEEKAAAWAKVDRLTNMFSDSPVMQGIARDAGVLKNVVRFNYLGGLVPDWGDKLAGGLSAYGPHSAETPAIHVGIPHLDTAYNNWKESWFPESSVWPAEP
ncbi:MAG: hypothetical protein J2P30_19535 [Actinobacteria bacterium]|nr:hypothetical protein [Actinomycetota bacterium]MBO0817325.1 hypothetical protein [Actinomycetota bacterium]